MLLWVLYVNANDTLSMKTDRARSFDIFVSTYNTIDVDHEDDSSMFLRNNSIHLSEYTAKQSEDRSLNTRRCKIHRNLMDNF
jgi:hypothetical protein